MNPSTRVCLGCRNSLKRLYSIRKTSNSLAIDKIFESSSWSVSSLLPPLQSDECLNVVTSEQLDHLLRLSALPRPEDDAKRRQMLRELGAQLHFVKSVQDIDTRGVEPLRSITTDRPMELDYEEACVEREAEVPQDYMHLARRKQGRYYIVDGGLLNNDTSIVKD